MQAHDEFFDGLIDQTRTCLGVIDVSIRDHFCENDAITFWEQSTGSHLQVDGEDTGCDCFPWAATSKKSENDFGNFNSRETKNNHACSANSSSTTN